MVCKEDVLSWFKDLESYKRIDLMYELLNMCVPFEIRFVGSCVEEIGKHSYHELRGPAIIANDVEKLSKDASLSQGILEDNTRHRVLLYVSLVSARNCTCANWLYKNVFRTDWLEDFIVKENFKDDNVQSELLLLFTMGVHHPAFSFEQKLFFGRILTLLIERENRLPPKGGLFNCPHPPGIGYPPNKLSHLPEVPVKTALPVSHHGDIVPHHAHPPGLTVPPIPPPPLELLAATLWNRPGFAGTVCGAPEVPPFRPPPISPLVSQAGSPPQSRSTSPHRTLSIRPPPLLNQPPLNIQPVEAMPPIPQLALDSLSNSSLPIFSTDIKLPDEELNHIPDDKLRETPWVPSLVLPMDPKPINGIRFTPYTKLPQQSFLVEQMQALSLDGENSLHHSNSSSNSSLNHSPPDTPTVAPHGPGRGDSKGRGVNGMPPYIIPSTGPPLCDVTPPPPSLPVFTNCSVPYSNYPAPLPLHTRSIFPYNTPNYRPPFTAPAFTYQPTDNVYSTYTVPYVSVMYSSPQFAPRNPNCYNCGATGHSGANCNGPTIEHITEKKAYMLEYASPPPDAEK